MGAWPNNKKNQLIFLQRHNFVNFHLHCVSDIMRDLCYLNSSFHIHTWHIDMVIVVRTLCYGSHIHMYEFFHNTEKSATWIVGYILMFDTSTWVQLANCEYSPTCLAYSSELLVSICYWNGYCQYPMCQMWIIPGSLHHNKTVYLIESNLGEANQVQSGFVEGTVEHRSQKLRS